MYGLYHTCPARWGNDGRDNPVAMSLHAITIDPVCAHCVLDACKTSRGQAQEPRLFVFFAVAVKCRVPGKLSTLTFWQISDVINFNPLMISYRRNSLGITESS